MKVSVGGDLSGAVILLSEKGGADEMRAPQKIYGEPFDASCLNGVERRNIIEPDRIAWKLLDVTVVGNNALLYGNQLFVSMPIVTEEQHKKIDIENKYNHHGFLLQADVQSGEKFAYFASARRRNHFPGLGVFFANLEPNNYGSFLFRVLPQMLFLADMDVKFDFYVTSGRTSWFLEALRLANLPIRPVFSVAEVIGDHFQSIITFSDFCIEGWLDAATRRRISKLVENASQAKIEANTSNKKLYISRLLGGGARPHYRRLVNETELASRAQAHGFKLIFPETMLFSQQILTFYNADTVIGPSGSGMLNAIFSPRDTTVVDMESFHNTVRQHARIYSSTGKRYNFLFGSIENKSNRVAFSDWKVDEGLFETCLKEIA
ncbi:glycosyltransferase family 61 protein [Acidisoma cellulosilytica]|uniref:Glycosyltransferase family 61 protein n=1 Tax=Acidisoma cellulosilyticum TaxID=2802395 RepID=A0A963YXQ0_9PROT|nr:glycosyltransferase family 61 protein [Acidisoma cellulosilyticum]MCB8878769.1 glycosyltransferase family 61 protein [Acidisoma cellulosilyticum]